MDGVGVILALLAADEGVQALVDVNADPERIAGDVLAKGVVLPAYRVWKVSGNDLNTLKAGASRHVTQRIQMEAHGATVAQVKAAMAAGRNACSGKVLAVLGPLTRVSVTTDTGGPQGFDPLTGNRMETQDFRVSYNETADATVGLTELLEVVDGDGNEIAVSLVAADGDGNIYELG